MEGDDRIPDHRDREQQRDPPPLLRLEREPGDDQGEDRDDVLDDEEPAALDEGESRDEHDGSEQARGERGAPHRGGAVAVGGGGGFLARGLLAGLFAGLPGGGAVAHRVQLNRGA